MKWMRTAALSVAAAMLLGAASYATPQCYVSYGGQRPNKLYLYFPSVDDPSYPEFAAAYGLPPTSPAKAFNIANLPNYTGTAADLRSAIYDVVADDYCEFNVEVIATTTAPPTTYPRRNTVSIGTDDGTAYGETFGLAQAVDVGDATAVDFAHVYAATYQGAYGGPGGALNGANSTLERWARSIGGTAAHEAGHNYGLSHPDGLVLMAGEDALVHHLMASGDHYSGEDRAGYRRHFSDHEYSVLAANVGLRVQTLWNWDLINPNAETATSVRIDFLSQQPSLTVLWAYTGPWSPWAQPTVSGVPGTQVFKGVTYNRYQITWSVPQAWVGHAHEPGPEPGVPGQVGGGMSFHIGAGFSGVDYNLPDSVIVTNVTLLNGSTPLALHPRTVSFDSGALDAADGSLNVQAVNVGGAPIQIGNLQMQLLPRVLNINAMVAPAPRFVDFRNQLFSAWAKAKPITAARLFENQKFTAVRLGGLGQLLKKEQTLSFMVARLKDARHVVDVVKATDCLARDRVKGADVAKCKAGISVDLFPATAMYVTATATDPAAKHWDYKTKRYVVGPVTSYAFAQFVGRHPDLNKNGVDDYIDILTKHSLDRNGDGIPDEVQRRQ